MKIHFEHKSTVFEFERQPMPPERFSVLAKLAGAVIGGVVLLAAVHEVGIWAIAWAVGAMVLVGLGKLMVWLFRSVE